MADPLDHARRSRAGNGRSGGRLAVPALEVTPEQYDAWYDTPRQRTQLPWSIAEGASSNSDRLFDIQTATGANGVKLVETIFACHVLMIATKQRTQAPRRAVHRLMQINGPEWLIA